MAKVKITQIKSVIGHPERQRRTLRSLGIKRMHQTVEVEGTPQVLGMIAKVRHLIRVE
ncbi:MAG TPA: 50S ribosomal protein L30 [Tenuifilaceae bacterium]|jgi:large subunit ribosomal protein L30|nr:50S ribosomal protein L30 [Bacteroidales bacterium]HNT42219.1 50S ribosomal protein L30 [Tenuifilaceae bacterium]MBP8643154.1 50S ribosomal protein L30 [Bacteroidales bacterium]HNY09359.1 50S ribosomal protein L30 [Tenuifilaceae bacterium]HOA09356.1 50S ribosomal protein L30 [Tenuifilaceae bacterium]